MIGIDTNILLRLWLNDDPAQNRRIDALLAEHGGTPGSLLVTDVVLVEAVWTLRSAFDQGKDAQLIAVRSLLEEIAFAFEDRESVADAVTLFDAVLADLPTAWSSPSMPGRAASSPRHSTEACASCQGSRCSDLTRRVGGAQSQAATEPSNGETTPRGRAHPVRRPARGNATPNAFRVEKSGFVSTGAVRTQCLCSA